MGLAVCVVPIKRQTDVFFALPILAYFIVFLGLARGGRRATFPYTLLRSHVLPM